MLKHFLPQLGTAQLSVAGDAFHGGSLLVHNLRSTVTLLQTLNNQAVTYAADLWALGCILYQMLVGRPPFKAGTEYLTFQLIASGQVDMPTSLSPHAQDLLRRLLVPEASQRLGQIPCLHSVTAVAHGICIAPACVGAYLKCFVAHTLDKAHCFACLLAVCGQSSWCLARSAGPSASKPTHVLENVALLESVFVTVHASSTAELCHWLMCCRC